MKKQIPTLFFVFLSVCLVGQEKTYDYPYEVSTAHPFGLINPDAPKQIADFDPLIGRCNCKSISRIDQQTWADTVDMTWTFKYIMNGFAVQDETFKSDGTYAGSIRQFNVDSALWYVHYYSHPSQTAVLPAWEGNRIDDKIILYRDQTAPNGMDGYYKITFSEISQNGFNWLGEWVTKNESFSYPTWRIYCKKQKASRE